MFLEAPPDQRGLLLAARRQRKPSARSALTSPIAYPVARKGGTMRLVGVLYGEGYQPKEYYRGEEEVGVMAAIAGVWFASGRSMLHRHCGSCWDFEGS